MMLCLGPLSGGWEEMSQAYGEASQQQGTGTDVHQKAAVTRFVQSKGGSYFEGVVDALRNTLDLAMLYLISNKISAGV